MKRCCLLFISASTGDVRLSGNTLGMERTAGASDDSEAAALVRAVPGIQSGINMSGECKIHIYRCFVLAFLLKAISVCMEDFPQCFSLFRHRGKVTAFRQIRLAAWSSAFNINWILFIGNFQSSNSLMSTVTGEGD